MNEKVAALKAELALLKLQFSKKIEDVEASLKNLVEQESLHNFFDSANESSKGAVTSLPPSDSSEYVILIQ